MQLGADVDALDRMAATLAAGASRVRQARRSLDASVAAARWTGPDARRFTRAWRASSASCAATAAALDAAASAARAHAAQQRRASRAGDVVVPGPRLGPASSAAGAPLLEPAPRRIRVATVAADVSLGPVVAVGGSEQWRLDDLPDGRVRIGELTTDTVGVQAGRGMTVDLAVAGRQFAAGSGVQVAAMAGLGAGRSWTVAADQVDDLLARRAAGLVLGADLVPAPDAQRRVLGVDVAAVAGAALADGRAGADARLGVGVSAGRDRRAGTVEVAVDSTVAASLAAVFGGHVVLDRSVDTAAMATLTTDRHGTPLRLDLVTSTMVAGRRGDELVRRRIAVDLTAPQVRAPATVLARELTGRVPDGRGLRRTALALADAMAGAATVTDDRYRVATPVSFDLSAPVGSVAVRVDDYRLVPGR